MISYYFIIIWTQYWQVLLPVGKELSKSICNETRKMVNFTWIEWSQGKPWWKFGAIRGAEKEPAREPEAQLTRGPATEPGSTQETGCGRMARESSYGERNEGKHGERGATRSCRKVLKGQSAVIRRPNRIFDKSAQKMNRASLRGS